MDESLLAAIKTLEESLKGKRIVNPSKKGGHFKCQVTGLDTDNRYHLEVPPHGRSKKAKRIGCFVTLPVAVAHINAVFHSDPDSAALLIAHLCAQYKQERIAKLPCTLMELAANPSIAVSGDMATWLEVPGAESAEEHKESRPKRKAKEPKEEGEIEEGASPKKKRAKKAAPKIELAKFETALVRPSKNEAKAVQRTRRVKLDSDDENAPVAIDRELTIADVNQKRAALAKHERFQRAVVQGALLEYVAYAEGEKGKRNPWFPDAAGDILVSCGSRKVVFKIADEAAAPADDEQEQQ